MLVNTIFGVILASVMIVGLSALDNLSSPSEILTGPTAPVDETKLVGGNIEDSADFRSPSEIEIAESPQSGDSDSRVFANTDPIGLGAPFSIAIIAGLAMFMVVRNRLN